MTEANNPLAMLDQNIDRLKSALAAAPNDYILAWWEHQLAVKFDELGVPIAVAPYDATAVEKSDHRRVINGHNEAARVVSRTTLMQHALEQAIFVRDHLQQAISEKKERDK